MNIDNKIKIHFLLLILMLQKGINRQASDKKNTLTHLFAKYNADLDFDNFVESSLNISVQKVNNDTYLKIFDTNIVDTELKPDNLDTLTSDLELNLEHEKFTLDTGFTAYERFISTQ